AGQRNGRPLSQTASGPAAKAAPATHSAAGTTRAASRWRVFFFIATPPLAAERAADRARQLVVADRTVEQAGIVELVRGELVAFGRQEDLEGALAEADRRGQAHAARLRREEHVLPAHPQLGQLRQRGQPPLAV